MPQTVDFNVQGILIPARVEVVPAPGPLPYHLQVRQRQAGTSQDAEELHLADAVRATLHIVQRPEQQAPMPDRPETKDDRTQVACPDQPLLDASTQQRSYIICSVNAARPVDERSGESQLGWLGGGVDVVRPEQATAGDVDTLQVRQRSGSGHEELRSRRRRPPQATVDGGCQAGQHDSAGRTKQGDPQGLLGGQWTVVADDHLPVPLPQS